MLLVFDIDGGTDLLQGQPDVEIVVPKHPNDILKRLLQIRANPGNVKTIGVDVLTGLFTMNKQVQRPEPSLDKEYKGDFGLNWNELMGRYHDLILIAKDITRQHPINFVMTAHVKEDYIDLSVDGEGKKVKRLTGWSLDVPGRGDNDLMSPFDEVYLLTASVAGRQLHTSQYMINGFPFKSKSRFGVKGPITNPTYESIIKALPPHGKIPRKFCLVGEPGVGKSTLLGTFPR